MSSEDHRGILRNRDEGSPTVVADKLDRNEVIKNTILNSKLSGEQQSKSERIRAKIQEAKDKEARDKEARDKQAEGEHHQKLQWDEVKLYQSEQEKNATMKIDEPKTPYENGFDPTGEYYQEDDDEEIPDFNLGKGAANEGETTQSLAGAEIIPGAQEDDDEEEEEEDEPREELTAEEKHKKFDEMRKNHYHMKATVLGKKIDISDDEDDE